MKGKLVRSVVAVALAGLTAWGPAAPAYGQSQPLAQAQQAPPFTIPAGRDYTIPQRPWRNVLLPYTAFHVDEPDLTNSQRVQQLIQNGKMQLSLNDAVELALENNVDIGVQRYWPWIAETDILRAKGGGAQRGVQFVTTPTAFANIPAITFDPVVTTLTSIDNRILPVNNPLTAGTGTAASAGNPALHTSTELANFQYAQGFHTGTNMAIAFNNTRASTSSAAVRFDPDVQSVMSLTLSQQLLNGFGRLPNERYIRVALLTKKVTDQAFLQTLITDLTAVENDYWELVFARGNVDVQQHAVDLAQQLYNDNQKQVEIGTLAPIEIVRAEAQVATAQQGLINAQTAQLQEQTLLMSVITKNPSAPELRNVEIVPTETTRPPAQVEDTPLTDLIAEALTKRPDILQARMNLDADDINAHITRNALLPQLTLSALASGTGLGGNVNTTTSTTVAGSQIVDVSGLPVTVLPTPLGPAIPIFSPSTHTTVTGVTTGGFGDALSQIFRGTNPEFTFQLAMNLPIRNRVAEADNARALLVQRQDQTRLQATVNNITVDVQNAQIVLRQDRASLAAAQKTRELQEQTLDAEQKKFQLGASTIFLVVTDQQALAVAAAAEVRAQVNLEEAKVNFERAMGRTLEVNNVTLANGTSGVLPHDTLIPGTTVTGALISTRPTDGAMGLTK